MDCSVCDEQTKNTPKRTDAEMRMSALAWIRFAEWVQATPERCAMGISEALAAYNKS